MKAHLAKNIKYSRKIIVLIAFLIITVFFSGCSKKLDSNIVLFNVDDYSLYPKVLEEALPFYKIEESENNPYHILNQDGIAEAFDTQAVGAIQTGIAKNWYPQYLATVIIAVDRDRTDSVVSTWSDLFSTQEEVGFFDTSGNIQMLTAALAYGLEGENYTLRKTIELLTSLHKKKLLKINSFQAPIIICYDYQAAQIIENGGNMEIIIPSEGTFTYEKGLLSNKILDFQGDIDKLLLESKLPLLNGERDASLYPDKLEYERAVKVDDYKYFAKTTENIKPLFERKVLNSKKFMSIDNREHFLFALIYIIIITLWIVSIIRRSMQRGFSYAAFFTGIILIAWTFVRLVKYQIESNPMFSRYLWYSFYIFQLTLPLVLLWMAWAIDKPKNQYSPPKWWRNMLVLIGILIILVFTNDFHGFVLELDLNRPDWAIEYGYSFGYYIILFVSMMNLLGVFIILLQKSIRNPRKKGFIFPLLLFIMFGIYNYKYITRDPFVYATDITIITGLFTMIMFELCIRSGLIPVNTKYIELFTRSPLKMQIINKDGEVELSSTSAAPLDKDIIEKVLAISPRAILQDNDTVLFSKPIPGGYAIWHEDISKIQELHRKIQKSTQMLIEANTILAEEEKIQRSINEKTAKKQLMEQLETEIAGSIKKLLRMIEKLPKSENHSIETTRIALLLCYIKRRCNMFFKEKKTSVMDVDELIVYINELSEIGKYSDIQIATINEIKGKIAIRYAILFYDFFYLVADIVVQRNFTHIIQHIGYRDEFLSMGFLIPEDLEDFKLEPSFIDAIDGAKGKIVRKELEDCMGISIAFPKGGDKYD